MIEHPQLMPECFADTLLVDMLIGSTSSHKRSITQVFAAFKKEFSNRRAVGIIDDDKKKDAYYNEFNITEETDCYRYLAHPNKRHFLIVIKKDLEDLIIKCAKTADIEHKLLGSVQQLKRVTKDMNVSKNTEVKDLINTLIQKKVKPLVEIQKILRSHIQ